ncbi:hypothetical protein JHC09_03030 [Devosia sp. MC532]|uniref:hypothetical protein n=1 Tax=Devosia sp. MC532 TaxID=2799788 RepID=UPI0018F3F646|nr:hypothetical protein [Devosia sp. MC532]MBJ7576855.1 hypothetical protein [Devosia sp. MC532]
MTVDECGWASCSLLAYDESEDDPLRRARDFFRLKKLKRKYRFFARVELDNDNGVVAPNDADTVHFHLWAFKHAPQPKVLGFEEA